MRFLGIDTSNYTTSAAVYDSSSGQIVQKKKLLTVPEGGRGLRQSDALFQHVKELPNVAGELLDSISGEGIAAVGASLRPRNAENSYMPCFLAGETAGRCIGSAMHIPFFGFSHQQGHIAAALFSIKHVELMSQRFIAFHVSGGTTEALLVFPGNNGNQDMLNIVIIAQSLDLKAGQAIDRIGVKLHLGFPAGPKLEALSKKSTRNFKIKPTLRGLDCSLSGIENKCVRMIESGEPYEDTAKYCIDYILATLDEMTARILKEYGRLPLVFAGGVMSNRTIREHLSQKYGAYFAEPIFSSDNAAGISLLTKIKAEGLG